MRSGDVIFASFDNKRVRKLVSASRKEPQHLLALLLLLTAADPRVCMLCTLLSEDAFT